MTAFDHIRAIVAQHRHRQSLSNPYRDELDDTHLPGIIRAPSGREIIFDPKTSEAVHDLADGLRKDDPDLDRSVSNDEWVKLIRESVAYALDDSDPSADLDDTARHVLDRVKSALALSKSALRQFEFAFGCTLFDGDAQQPFCIGPVRIETRQDWLERKFAEGAISDQSRQRVLRAWEERKDIKECEQEWAIVGLSHEASFICSVGTNGMAHEFGQQRARTTARLALAVIALRWQGTSQTLEGMNLVNDRIVRNLYKLTFRDGQIAIGGVRKSHRLGGPRLEADEWDKLQSDFAGYFTVVGDLLKSIVDIVTPPKRPNTTHALTHALLWFHQGCREDEPVIAVVNFASVLDCLVSGAGRDDIEKLIKARLGLDAEKKLWVRWDQTVKEAVEEIYDHARTATIHGLKDRRRNKPDSKPFHDWNPARDRAEALARYCLLACIDWAVQHPDSDDPKAWRTS